MSMSRHPTTRPGRGVRKPRLSDPGPKRRTRLLTIGKYELETFPNPVQQRDYTIRMSIPEFTCLCPKTGQPDFATLDLEYIPDKLCVELTSLKIYIWSDRHDGG